MTRVISQTHILTTDFSEVRAANSSLFCVVFCRSLFVSFPLAIVCPSSNGFLLPLWYLQTFRKELRIKELGLTAKISQNLLGDAALRQTGEYKFTFCRCLDCYQSNKTL